jgi:hypothetical protein
MNYNEMTDKELQRLLAEEIVDLPERIALKEEIGRRTREALSERQWSRSDKWVAASLVVAAAGVLVALANPELRRFVGLDSTIPRAGDLRPQPVDAFTGRSEAAELANRHQRAHKDPTVWWRRKVQLSCRCHRFS